MTVKTFIWSPLNGPTGDISWKTRTVQFGDGYEQVIDEGMNREKQSWPLTFTDKWAEIKPILEFLREHGTSRSFKWVNPVGELGLYRASQLKPTPLGFGNWTLSVTFTTAYRS